MARYEKQYKADWPLRYSVQEISANIEAFVLKTKRMERLITKKPLSTVPTKIKK